MSEPNQLDLSPVLESARLFLESDDVDFITGSLLLAVMGKFLLNKAVILLYKPEAKEHILFKKKGRVSAEINQVVSIDDLDADKTRQILIVEEKHLSDNLDGISYLFNLKSGTTHIGYLGISKPFNKSSFSEQETEFINALAALASISLSNARLIERLKNANRKLDQKIYELNTLFDLSKQFNQLEGREQIADMLKFTLMGHLFIRKFFFYYRPSVDSPDHICISKNGIDIEVPRLKLDLIFDKKFDSDIINVQDHPELSFLSEVYIQKLILLHFQKDRLAILGLGSKANGTPFDKADESLILSMSNLALLSIQKVSLLQQKIEKERMEEEINLAKGIQQGLLPGEIPSYEQFDISGFNVPSRQVGGDYYDIIERQSGELYAAIADVTGKGFAASLLMSNLQAAMHTVVEYDADLASATARLNDTIYKNTPSDKFITFFWCRINPEARKITYVNAGHNPPYLYRKKTNELIELDQGGLLLGAMPTMMPYEQAEFDMEEGDIIISFTDGVTEAFNDEEEEYGEERLMRLIQKYCKLSAKELTDHIVEDVMTFANGIQYDDITILIIKAI